MPAPRRQVSLRSKPARISTAQLPSLRSPGCAELGASRLGVPAGRAGRAREGGRVLGRPCLAGGGAGLAGLALGRASSRVATRRAWHALVSGGICLAVRACRATRQEMPVRQGHAAEKARLLVHATGIAPPSTSTRRLTSRAGDALRGAGAIVEHAGIAEHAVRGVLVGDRADGALSARVGTCGHGVE